MKLAPLVPTPKPSARPKVRRTPNPIAVAPAVDEHTDDSIESDRDSPLEHAGDSISGRRMDTRAPSMRLAARGRETESGTIARRIAELSIARDPSTSFEPVPARELLSRGIMAKLVVGDANDPLEHEADAIADRVMRMPVANASAGIRRLAFTSATIRRTCSACEAEDDELHRTMAPLQRACSSCEAEDDELQRTTAPLQRACTACEAEDDELRREPAAGARGGPTTPRFTSRLHDLQRQGGSPLTTDARAFFEPRFNTDLTEVRLHTDRTAAQLAQQIHARAFTSGQHIFFGPGEHRPHSQAGQRLLAHELAHTQQNARAELELHRSAADNLVSSMDNTAEYVLEDIAGGMYSESGSNPFEERIRKLSKSERQLLRDMMVDQSWEEQDIINDLILVLDLVISGYRGVTVGHVDSRPCEPGDVEPVSEDEWIENPIIIDLELADGSGDSEGKLGRHTPASTLELFQRALIQWGCESAEPARNPLPKYGADGSYGNEFRSAVRQFQRLERLSVDGTAGPKTVKAMAVELYGINLRDDVEREQDLEHAQDQLDAETVLDKDIAARETRIEGFIQRLYAEGKRYRENQGAQYEANVSMLVAQKISGYAPEIISEGLERVQLQDRDFYEHVLFGGRLITSLQELGVFGVEYTPPSDADFLDGFIIESRNLEHASPLNSPEFSGWDIPEIFVGFQIGTAQGIAKGFVEAVEGVAAMFTAEFWKAMYEMVPKLISEPNFRFEIGRASVEMLHKQLTELNASSPYDYGNKLGVLFGMLVLEVAVGVLTGGAGAAALKGFDGAKLLAKFPRLEKLGKRVASTSLARAGGKLGSKLAEGAMAILARVDEIVVRVRKLLPDLTSDAKLGSKLDEFEDADRLIALADQKSITRKLEQVELERTKVDLALDRAEPDFDQVDRLATGLEKRATALEDLLEYKGAGKRGVSPAAVSKQTLELVEQGRDIQKLSKLPPEVRAAELRYVDAAKGREISLKIWDKDFDREVELPNDHTYRHADKEATWCRFSEGGPDNCIPSGTDVEGKTLSEGGEKSRTPVHGADKYRAEASLSNRPTKTHGTKWNAGDAQQRANQTRNPQGKFGSQADVDFVLREAQYLKVGDRVLVPAPAGTKNILHLPDTADTTSVTTPATHVFIEIQPAGNGGTIHAFPVPADYRVTQRTTKKTR